MYEKNVSGPEQGGCPAPDRFRILEMPLSGRQRSDGNRQYV